MFREVDVRTTDIELQLADGIAHRDGHRSGGDEVTDLRREICHEMSGKGVVGWCNVVLDNLKDCQKLAVMDKKHEAYAPS